jgi:hypothetical protein
VDLGEVYISHVTGREVRCVSELSIAFRGCH